MGVNQYMSVNELTKLEKILDKKCDTLVNTAMARRDIRKEISSYLLIQEKYESQNFDEDFRKAYKWFYKLDAAGLGNTIKDKNFDLIKDKVCDLNKILSEIYDIPTIKGYNSIQLSFATKIMHTINNDLPIYDANVGKLLSLKKVLPSKYNKEERIKSANEIFQDLERKFNHLLNSNAGEKAIKEFYKLPIENIDKIPKIKALDFCFWILGA